MAKFRKDGGRGTPAISTASLPDIVFMLLFFFMVATTMREVELKVASPILPEATEVKKLENKSLVSYIYVGPPLIKYQKIFGKNPRIQLNDAIKDVSDISVWIQAEREQRDPAEVPLMTTALKVDKDTKMGIITDIKQELRKVQALKINYTTKKPVE